MADSYAGYVKRATPINWGAVAGDIVNKMGDVEKEQEAFREKYDTMASDLYKELGDYEAGKSQEMNQFVYNGIAAGRDNLGALHQKLKRREISPDDFNRATMSMSSEMDKLKQLTTNYNDAIVGAIEGIDNGKLDNVLSGWALTKFGELSNLKGKNLQWMPGKDGYTTLYVNEEGKEPISMSVATNPANLIFNKVDLIKELKPSMAAIGKYKTAIANGTLDDATQREGYAQFKQGLINKILNNDKAIASVLVQYGEYKPYSEGDTDIPTWGIKMEIGESGKEFNPDVKDLKWEAEEIVENFIDQMVKYEKTKFKEYKPSKGGYTNEELNIFNQGYNATWSATNAVYEDGKLKGFEFMDNQRYNFDIEADDTIVVTNKKGDVMIEGLKRGSAETAKALAPYYSEKFGGTGWQVIHNQEQRIGKVPGEVEREEYVASADDIKLIDEVTRMSYDNVAEAQQKIVDLMSSVNPLIEKDIEFLTPTSDIYLGYINFKIGDETFKIAIDEGKGLMDVFDEQTVTDNKNEITKAINKSLGIKTEEEKKEPKPTLNASTRNG